MLNSQQADIVRFNGKALCVVAGAGSGKTTTIIQKIIKMIQFDKLNHKHFFITTFTRNAANQLKYRLKQHLSSNIVEEMTIGTFHSIAYKYLNKYQDKSNNTLTSFDKLLFDYLQLIQSETYNVKEIHKYIFIDEFQDIDQIQHSIVRSLFDRSELLIVIGDDQQNIYTFRGSDISYILDFQTTYNGSILKLETNYRSFPAIIYVSNYLISYAIDKIDKIFVPDPAKLNKKTRIRLKLLDTDLEIIKYISDKINNIKAKGYDLSKFAIVSRTKYILTKIEHNLAKKNIPTLYLESELDNHNISNRLVLSTIHGTKGLEYHNLIFVDFEPNKLSSIEEERRLYYVGITRAIRNLMIIIKKEPSKFLIEIFTKAHQHQTLFKNFDTSFLLKALSYDISDNTNMSDSDVQINLYSVSNIIENLNWLQYLCLDNIIKFIDIRYECLTIHNKLTNLLTNSSNTKSDQLISNYGFLIGIVVESYIQYMISNIDPDFIFSIIDTILIGSTNIKHLLKNPSYGQLLKRYIGLDVDFDLAKYTQTHLEYLNDLKEISKSDNLAQYDSKSFDKDFLQKCGKSYSALIKKDNMDYNNLIENILIYSIHQSIISSQRFSLQYLNLLQIKKSYNQLNICDKFVDLIKSKQIYDYAYDNICFQRKLSYVNNQHNKIVGRLDILLETKDDFLIIDIKAIQNETPDIKYLLQVIIYSCMYMIETNKKAQYVGIYSALNGYLFLWNLHMDKSKARLFLDNLIN